MREAFGNTFIVNIVLLFVVVFIFLFVGSISYTKAYKIKNKIINYIEDSGNFEKQTQDKIKATLKEMGYRVVRGKQQCNDRGGTLLTRDSNSYRYCVVEYENDKGVYYGVTTYMYFDFPLINALLEFPIYGETKIIGILE